MKLSKEAQAVEGLAVFKKEATKLLHLIEHHLEAWENDEPTVYGMPDMREKIGWLITKRSKPWE